MQNSSDVHQLKNKQSVAYSSKEISLGNSNKKRTIHTYNDMNESEIRSPRWNKSYTKRIHSTWLHLYKRVYLKQAKFVCGEKVNHREVPGYTWVGAGTDCEEHTRMF